MNFTFYIEIFNLFDEDINEDFNKDFIKILLEEGFDIAIGLFDHPNKNYDTF